MAIDISQYTNQIASAIYGRDVRSSIVNGLLACANTAGLEILGSYDTLADLEVAHPTGNEGDYYLAGLDLYYWINSAWSKVCQFKGTGVKSIAKTGTSGLVDTYTITYTDGTTATYTVTNGNGIASYTKTGTSGLVDTYTITFTDGTTTTVNVTNGRSITSIDKTGTTDLVDTYTITYNDSTTSTFTVTNGFSPTATVVQNADNSITVTITDKNGTTTATVPAGSYTLPVATATTLGGVKIGTGVSATADGTLSADVTSVNGNTGAVTVTDITGNAATATTAAGYSDDGAIATALAGKQATLAFDTTPTSGSTNPVTSGGIEIALAAKTSFPSTNTVDITAYNSSSNVYTATENGFANVDITTNGGGNFVFIYSSSGMSSGLMGPSTGYELTVWLPIAKGQTVYYSAPSATINKAKFYIAI